MSYADEAALNNDQVFRLRVQSCLCEESLGKPTDDLAQEIMRNPLEGVIWFMPFLSVAPTFGDKYADGGQEAITDGDLLAAVQADWDAVAALHAEPVP